MHITVEVSKATLKDLCRATGGSYCFGDLKKCNLANTEGSCKEPEVKRLLVDIQGAKIDERSPYNLVTMEDNIIVNLRSARRAYCTAKALQGSSIFQVSELWKRMT